MLDNIQYPLNHRPFVFILLEYEAIVHLLGSGVHQCEGGKSVPRSLDILWALLRSMGDRL